MSTHRRIVVAGVLALSGAGPLQAQAPAPLDSAFLAGMEWRSIGPANMMGRVTDVEGIPSPSATFYFAAAAGGIWKTTNGGITYRPVFDDQRVVAMGDLAIAPSDTLQIWAGTGEEDARNSISPGGGIYKSTDGGETWTLKGLEATEHIARIVVHPRNPDVVWVAASGPMWRESEDRGLYKTTDGGETWRKVKYVSERAGFIDVALDPANPDHLLASSWERMRGPYYLQSGGPGSALWESTDAGESWTEVTGGGFPETELGRIGIAFSPSDPRIVYTLVEAAAPAEGEDRLSGLYRSTDGGDTWERMNDTNSRPFYYSQVRVDPVDPDRVYFSSFNFSEDAGKTVRGAAQGVHVDHHAQWIDPADPNHFITGNDGGIAITFDRGGNYLFPNVVPIGQFYAVSYDMAVPYRVCGGLQDNYSWCGPSRKSNDAITNHDWFSVSGGDGFVTAQDPRDPDIIYSESQGGNIGRMDLATGQRTSLDKPDWRDTYRMWQDSIALIWPDTTVAPAAGVQQRVERYRAAATRDSAALDLRWNWNTPFFLSPHDADVLYAAANRVLKSTQRGDSLKLISPDLTRQDTMKIRVSTQTTGGITPDVTGAETFATIVSLAESPLRRGMLYAGTDDGNLWITTDDGGRWTELTGKLVGLVPDGTYISRIEPSAHVPTRVYVTLDNHRRGDFTPYVLVSEDAGRSFHSIASDLPTGGPDFAHVIREDPVNPDLLYVGTDVGAYVSLDRGGHWQRFMNGLPTVPVHDLKIHPRDHELIAGTHGRSIWIANVAPLQQLRTNTLAAAAHLFTPTNAQLFGTAPTGGEFTAQLYFQQPTPGSVATLTYWVGSAAQDSGRASLVITNQQGDTVQTLNGPASRGLHSVTWNLRGDAEQLPLSPSEKRDSVATERRLAQVVDSLAAAGTDRAELDRAVEQIRSNQGGFGGFGGRGGNQNQERGFQERPAEGAAPRGGGGGGGGGGRGGPGGGNDLVQTITQAVRGDQGGRGGRRFGGGSLFPRRTAGPAPIADAGRYTVTLKVGDTTQTSTLIVEHAPSAPTR